MGFVRPELVEPLLKGKFIKKPIEALPFLTSDELGEGNTDLPNIEDLDDVTGDDEVDLTTLEGVKAKFGSNIDLMKAYCDTNEIKYHKTVKRPETFYVKISKHHQKNS